MVILMVCWHKYCTSLNTLNKQEVSVISTGYKNIKEGGLMDIWGRSFFVNESIFIKTKADSDISRKN